MSHHIYTTDAYVFRHDFNRDADTMVYLFTKELGYIRAVAAGSRYEKSKHRFALQDYSYSNFSFVKGKGGWRITSAAAYSNIHTELHHDHKKLFVLYARIIKILQRLVQGEEGDSELFDIFHQGIEFGKKHADEISGDAMQQFELLFLSRLLEHLGYLALPNYIPSEPIFSLDHLEKIEPHTKPLTLLINQSLAGSHL